MKWSALLYLNQAGTPDKWLMDRGTQIRSTGVTLAWDTATAPRPHGRPLGEGSMTREMLLADLTRIAHELWRLRLIGEGWRLGPYRPECKTHDALVPYEELSRGDRLVLRSHVSDEHIEQVLTDDLRYPRGPDRPFLIEDMVIGLEVVFRDRDLPARLEDVPFHHRGRVINWTAHTGGELSNITVRWNNGEVSEYDPWLRELARAGELK